MAKSQTSPGIKAPLWATLTATFFYIGRLKPGPGTWASAVTVLVWYACARGLTETSQAIAASVVSLAVILIGIPAGTRVARELGVGDPSRVVIDEVAGQMIALIGAPLHWKPLLAGLILFRAFDIVKPFPLRRLERLPEGTGIMLDDVGAGLYALALMQLAMHFGLFA